MRPAAFDLAVPLRDGLRRSKRPPNPQIGGSLCNQAHISSGRILPGDAHGAQFQPSFIWEMLDEQLRRSCACAWPSANAAYKTNPIRISAFKNDQRLAKGRT